MGRRADNGTSKDPPTQTLNSVVDHRSVFVKLHIFDHPIKAVCDSEASVSCLSSETFDTLQTQRALQLTPSTTPENS